MTSIHTQYELPSEEEMKALPRKVGRMKKEEVVRLAQEMKRLEEEHNAIVVYPTPRTGYHRDDPCPPSTFRGCPHCKETPPWREIDVPCVEMVELQKEVDAWAEQKEHRLNDYDALNRRNQHHATCKICTFKDMYYDGYFSCGYTPQLNERWRLYVSRRYAIELRELRKNSDPEVQWYDALHKEKQEHNKAQKAVTQRAREAGISDSRRLKVQNTGASSCRKHLKAHLDRTYADVLKEGQQKADAYSSDQAVQEVFLWGWETEYKTWLRTKQIDADIAAKKASA